MKRRLITLLACSAALVMISNSAALNVYARPDKGERIELKATDTAQLKKLIESKTVNAVMTDGTRIKGKVRQVRDGTVTLRVESSEGKSALAKGENSVPTASLSTIIVTKRKGRMRAILGTVMGLVGLGLGVLVIATEWPNDAGWSGGEQNALVAGLVAGGAVAGYFWGRSKDKKEVTIVIR